MAGNLNDCRAWAESGAKAAVGNTMTIADGGYPGTGLYAAPPPSGEDLPDWKQAHNKSRKQARAHIEHAFARMETWKILRDCRLRGDGVHHAMHGIARLHNLAPTGSPCSSSSRTLAKIATQISIWEGDWRNSSQ
jgi:hypothetical protein